jgi:hypothetical protein
MGQQRRLGVVGYAGSARERRIGERAVHGGVMKVAPVAVVLTHGMDEQELDVVGCTGSTRERQTGERAVHGEVTRVAPVAVLLSEYKPPQRRSSGGA